MAWSSRTRWRRWPGGFASARRTQSWTPSGQGAEAVWPARSTPESENYGFAAVGLVGAAIDSLDARGPGDSARLTLQIAGNLSGLAIASATTSSCHAPSYPLTLRAGLAHGHCLAGWGLSRRCRARQVCSLARRLRTRTADNPRMPTFDSLVGQLSSQETGAMRCA